MKEPIKPPREQLWELAKTDIVVKNYLDAHDHGHLTYQEALERMAVSLAELRTHYQNELVKMQLQYGPLNSGELTFTNGSRIEVRPPSDEVIRGDGWWKEAESDE